MDRRCHGCGGTDGGFHRGIGIGGSVVVEILAAIAIIALIVVAIVGSGIWLGWWRQHRW